MTSCFTFCPGSLLKYHLLHKPFLHLHIIHSFVFLISVYAINAYKLIKLIVKRQREMFNITNKNLMKYFFDYKKHLKLAYETKEWVIQWKKKLNKFN